jgi:sulfide:quinone oxidoreductase
MKTTDLSAAFSVGSQIALEDVARLASLGFSDIVSNRPDGELVDGPNSRDLAAASEKHGVRFHYLPISPGDFPEKHRIVLLEILDTTDSRIFAYCRSGLRAASLWALAMAQHNDPESICKTCASHGFDVNGLKPRLADLAE